MSESSEKPADEDEDPHEQPPPCAEPDAFRLLLKAIEVWEAIQWIVDHVANGGPGW